MATRKPKAEEAPPEEPLATAEDASARIEASESEAIERLSDTIDLEAVMDEIENENESRDAEDEEDEEGEGEDESAAEEAMPEEARQRRKRLAQYLQRDNQGVAVSVNATRQSIELAKRLAEMDHSKNTYYRRIATLLEGDRNTPDTVRDIMSSVQTGRILKGVITTLEYRSGRACPIIFHGDIKIILHPEQLTDLPEGALRNQTIERFIGAECEFIVFQILPPGPDDDLMLYPYGIKEAVASRVMALNVQKERFMSFVEEGENYDAVIMAVMPKELILNCLGYDFILERRDMDYGLIGTLEERYRVNQHIAAKVTTYDLEKGRLAISPKLAFPHPFHYFVKRFERGALAIGVVRVMDMNYGYIVNLKIGNDKTVPCLCYNTKWQKIRPTFGDTVAVRIKSFNVDKRKIYGRIEYIIAGNKG